MENNQGGVERYYQLTLALVAIAAAFSIVFSGIDAMVAEETEARQVLWGNRGQAQAGRVAGETNEVIDPELENNSEDVSQINNSEADVLIDPIDSIAAKLKTTKRNVLLEEIQETADRNRELETENSYLNRLLTGQLDGNTEAIRHFITYGVDYNTKYLGAGERAAVMYSYRVVFNKLPETAEELADAIKIANGRWPSKRRLEAENKAKNEFKKIYLRDPDMENSNDNAAVIIMSYGLRQRAGNRNLESEQVAIKFFKNIYNHTPITTEEWNIVQTIAYSGATRHDVKQESIELPLLSFADKGLAEYTLTINGDSVTSSAKVQNESTEMYNDIMLRVWIEQGATKRLAGEAEVNCGAQLDTVQKELCNLLFPIVVKDIDTAGTGYFIPGPAIAIYELIQNNLTIDKSATDIELINSSIPATPAANSTSAPNPASATDSQPVTDNQSQSNNKTGTTSPQGETTPAPSISENLRNETGAPSPQSPQDETTPTPPVSANPQIISVPPSLNITKINDYNSPFPSFACDTNPLYNPIVITGSGSGNAPPGLIEQYSVQINWGDGNIENKVKSTFSPLSGTGNFNYSFEAGPHTYSNNGLKTITLRFYHQEPPGNDNQADVVKIIELCANHQIEGITVIKPNGDEIWRIGDFPVIEWVGVEQGNPVRVDLVSADLTRVWNLTDRTYVNPMTWWPLRGVFCSALYECESIPNAQYYVRITDLSNDKSDLSNRTFSILESNPLPQLEIRGVEVAVSTIEIDGHEVDTNINIWNMGNSTIHGIAVHAWIEQNSIRSMAYIRHSAASNNVILPTNCGGTNAYGSVLPSIAGRTYGCLEEVYLKASSELMTRNSFSTGQANVIFQITQTSNGVILSEYSIPITLTD